MNEYLKLILTSALGSGATLTIVELYFRNKREKRERTDAIKYLTLQLAFQFEAFAIECGRVASDNQAADESRGNDGSPISGVPQPKALPTSDAYRFLESEILNRVFAFSQKCQMAQESAVGSTEHGDDDDYRNAAEEKAVIVGSEGLEIAKALREEYELGPRKLAFDQWDIEQYFKRRKADFDEKKAKQEKAAMKLHAELSRDSTPN